MHAEPTLEELLVQHQGDMIRRLRRRGAGLLRYESEEDLAQGVHLRALQGADNFEYRGENAFFAFLASLVRAHVSDRHEYWMAARRNGGAMVRVTQVGPRSDPGHAPGVDPTAGITGPVTFAQRRDQLALAAQAVDVLLPRDQKLVAMIQEGLTIEEIAQALELSYDAAERARLRAIERFKKSYELLAGEPLP